MTRQVHHTSVAAAYTFAAASLTLCAALTLAACGASDDDSKAADKSPSTVPSPTRTASADPKETTKKEAIAAYGAYWQEMEKLYADPTGKGAHLDQYAASAALKNAQTDATRAHKRGNVLVGSVTITDIAVTKAETTGRIPHITLSSCLDISKWETVNAKTKKPADLPESRLLKYLIVSMVEKYPEGWRVTRDEPRGTSC